MELNTPPSSCQAAPALTERLRAPLAALLLISFYGLPWLLIQGKPAILFDLSQRQALLLGWQLGSDALPALLALGTGALSLLYLITHLGGRLWCGLACPQSILGRLHKQLMRAGKPLGHVLWALLAIWTGISFVGYFTPIRSLLTSSGDGWNAWTLFWAAFYALATWANIAFLRSRLCTELCPFARLQPWIADAHTPHVRYQLRRGEPRGARAAGLPGVQARGRGLLNLTTAHDYVVRAANPAIAGSWPQFAPNRLGDCLDCGLCQQQCPLQLDIRNGLDASCLDCGQCISACDDALARQGLPGGLIMRQSQAAVDGQAPRFWRRRTLLACAVLLVSAVSVAITQ